MSDWTTSPLRLSVHVELLLGISREEAVEDMALLARRTGASVEANFNGARVVVGPDGTGLLIPKNGPVEVVK